MQKPAKVNWGPVIFLVAYHAFLLAFLPVYFYFTVPSLGIVLTSIALLFITGLSITGGYHRYYSHKSYRAGSIVEAFMLFLGSMTAQGSALRWSFDHRNHHAHVDTDNDPYSIKKGFWYAHCLWILEEPRVIEPKIVSDLLKNKLVMFQHKYYKPCMLISNALVVTFLGLIFADFWGAFFIALWLRLFLLHHFTWFINSLAHCWGEKPFCQELTAVDNYFLSMLTFGEGYHNYHHTFANDYRNGIRWYHFDPTKWLIWTLSKLGLAKNLKRIDRVTIEKRMVMESRNALLEQLKELCFEKKEELEQSIHVLSERIVKQLAHFNQLKEDYLQKKREQRPTDIVRAMKNELKQIRKSLRDDWREFIQLSHSITSLREQPA
jgi:stearoyl-CoA desaturase (delta-9 desaturase)